MVHAESNGSEWRGLLDGARERLQRDYYAAAIRSTIAEKELTQVLAALAAASLPVVVLKGAALAAFYPDRVVRSYSDLDLLVPRDRVDQTEQTLNGLGYRCQKEKAWWTKHLQHLPPMMSESARLPVEIHWRLDDEDTPGRLPVEELWARAVPWVIEGQSALQLEPVDTALYLCRHAVAQHRVHLGLIPVCDLAQVVGDWTGDQWEAAARRATEYGLERVTYLMLALMEHILGVAVPEAVKSALRLDESVPSSQDLVEQFLSMEASSEANVPLALLQATTQEAYAARARRFVWHLFLPRDGMAAVYGIPADSPLIWLSYLWRPLDLVRRYGQALWSLLRRHQPARAAWAREAWLEQWLLGGKATTSREKGPRG
jgi:hypothetical protein